jgi:hypothetical protein
MDEQRTLTLPSGRTAAVRPVKGRDLIRAQRAAGPGADVTAVMMALVAELATVDGAQIVYEDVLEMDLADVLALQGEALGANFHRAASPAPQPSQQ